MKLMPRCIQSEARALDVRSSDNRASTKGNVHSSVLVGTERPSTFPYPAKKKPGEKFRTLHDSNTGLWPTQPGKGKIVQSRIWNEFLDNVEAK